MWNRLFVDGGGGVMSSGTAKSDGMNGCSPEALKREYTGGFGTCFAGRVGTLSAAGLEGEEC